MKVAEEILSYCTRCRMDLSHTVVAMQGDRAVRVQCKTCRSDHAYRAPKGAKEPLPKGSPLARSGGGKAAAEKKEVVTVEAEWQKLMAQSKAVAPKNYDARASFKAGDRVLHPTFGEGIVEKTVYPNKVQVVFRMDIKTLVHAGEAAAN